MKRNIAHKTIRLSDAKVNSRRKRIMENLLMRGMKSHASDNSSAHGISNSRIVIYKSEFEYIAKCILDRPDIETGGELFGHWTASGIPFVMYAIGPGPAANHQVTFFNQDRNYLLKVGHLLKKRFGLHHIGEWHSHHQLGLDRPSRYDVNTMTTSIREKNLCRFLLAIGTCKDDTATLSGYRCDSTTCIGVDWDVIPVDSPVRSEADNAFAGILVHPKYPNKTVCDSTKELDYGQ